MEFKTHFRPGVQAYMAYRVSLFVGLTWQSYYLVGCCQVHLAWRLAILTLFHDLSQFL